MRAVIRAVGGELRQDPLDLLSFGDKQLAQLVVGVHGLHRFDEECAAGCRNVVDEAGKVVFALAPDRHNEPVGADGDDRLAQDLGIRRRGDDLLQRFADLRALLADLAADRGKLAARRIGDLVLRRDAGVDFFFQIFVRHELEEPWVEHRGDAVAVGIIFHHAGRLETAGDLKQLLGAENAAAVGARKRRAHIADAAEARRALERDESARVGCLFLKRANVVRIVQRDERAAGLLGGLAARVRGQKLKHLVKLELLQGFFVQFIHISHSFSRDL